MLEGVLSQRNVKTKTKITIKSLVSLGIIVLAVALPQLVHLAVGAQGGMIYLPMYLPVVLGGCLLGTWWGLGIGILSPVVSFAITSIAGNAMPAAARLPFMIVELAVFALVSGLFSKLIYKNLIFSIPASLTAFIAGRVSFVALVAIFQGVTNLSVTTIWNQILMGWPGLLIIAIIVPIVITIIGYFLKKEKQEK